MLHLDSWYAQSHPDEDFAETFAVWLTPDSDWRVRYADWPALRKLEYMDALMKRDRRAAAGRRRRDAGSNRSTGCARRCGSTTRRSARTTGWSTRTSTTATCSRLFSNAPEHRRNRKASRFIQSIRRDVRRLVAEWTGRTNTRSTA